MSHLIGIIIKEISYRKVMLNIGEIINIDFREKCFEGVVFQILPKNKYKVIYESFDMPNLGRYIINEIEETTEGWSLIKPSSTIANAKFYKEFIEKLNCSKVNKND